MTAPTWTPLPEDVTAPDQIDREALDELDLLDEERIARCWRTRRGFLVMTNLRCADVWHKLELFGPTEWHMGPSLFFYNLAPPVVVAHRYLVLSEQYEENVGSIRFLVSEPDSVASEIDAARPKGRAEWEARHARVRLQLGAPPHRIALGPPTGVASVRCSFCGNPMDPTAARCPSCGAPAPFVRGGTR